MRRGFSAARVSLHRRRSSVGGSPARFYRGGRRVSRGEQHRHASVNEARVDISPRWWPARGVECRCPDPATTRGILLRGRQTALLKLHRVWLEGGFSELGIELVFSFYYSTSLRKLIDLIFFITMRRDLGIDLSFFFLSRNEYVSDKSWSVWENWQWISYQFAHSKCYSFSSPRHLRDRDDLIFSGTRNSYPEVWWPPPPVDSTRARDWPGRCSVSMPLIHGTARANVDGCFHRRSRLRMGPRYSFAGSPLKTY